MSIATLKKHTVILGAGITGLSIAHFLSKKNDDFLVIEKNHRVGGNIHTQKFKGYIIENGPNTVLLNNPSIIQLIKDCDLWDIMSVPTKTAQNNRFVLHQNTLQLLPRNPLEFLKSPLLKWHEKLKLFKEPFIKPHQHNTSIEKFITKRFGKAILKQFVEPFITGIYSGDVKTMSAKHTLKLLWDNEQQHGSVLKGMINKKKSTKAKMFNFPQGLSQLTEKIEQQLSSNIFCNEEILNINKLENSYEIVTRKQHIHCQRIISTLPSFALAKCLYADKLIEHLKNSISYVPIDVIHFGFYKKDVKNQSQGFGVLSKPSDHKNFLGILFNSRIFPHVSPHDQELFTIIVGGSRQPQLCQLKSNQLEEIILKEFHELMNCEATPIFSHHTKYNKGIPQYELNQDVIIEEIKKFENHNPNFHILGNYFDGISVSDSIQKAQQLVNSFKPN